MLRGGLRVFGPPTTSSAPRQVIPNKHVLNSAVPCSPLSPQKKTPLPLPLSIRLSSQRCLQRNSRTDLMWVQKERSTSPKGAAVPDLRPASGDLCTAHRAHETCLCKRSTHMGTDSEMAFPAPHSLGPPPSHIPLQKEDPGLKAKSPGARDPAHHNTGSCGSRALAGI